MQNRLHDIFCGILALLTGGKRQNAFPAKHLHIAFAFRQRLHSGYILLKLPMGRKRIRKGLPFVGRDIRGKHPVVFCCAVRQINGYCAVRTEKALVLIILQRGEHGTIRHILTI